MVLLDYPDSEGVTRELAIGYPRRLITSRPFLAFAVPFRVREQFAVTGR